MGSRPSRDRAQRAVSEPLCRLLRFEATDAVALSGLLYEPRRAAKRALIWLHGNGGASVFDSDRTNILANEFVAAGFAFFPFNNRGAHLIRTIRRRRRRIDGGTAHEVIRDCVPDIDGAVRELWRRGYRELHLIGHSTGANKVVVYDHRKPRNRIRSYVLLAGGDDTGLLYAALGARRFEAALAKGRQMIRDRRGHEIVPPRLSPMMMSWRSFVDMANPDGDYNVFPFFAAMNGLRLGRRKPFAWVSAIRKPSLYLYGQRDEFAFGDVARCTAILAQHTGPRAEIAVIADAGHGFGGHEVELAQTIVAWLP